MNTEQHDEMVLAGRAMSIKKVADVRKRVAEAMELGRDLEWSLMNDVAEAQSLERIWMQVDSAMSGVEADGSDGLTPTAAHQAIVDRLTERLLNDSYTASSSDPFSNAFETIERRMVSRFVRWMVW